MKKTNNLYAINKKLFFSYVYKNIDSIQFDQTEILISYLAPLLSLSVTSLHPLNFSSALAASNTDSISILALNSGDSSETISGYLRA
jgi:hypothetical protein